MTWARTTALALAAITLASGCTDASYSSNDGGGTGLPDRQADASTQRSDADVVMFTAGDARASLDSGTQEVSDGETPTVNDASPTTTSDAAVTETDAEVRTPLPDASSPPASVCPNDLVCSDSKDGSVQAGLTEYTFGVPYCADPTTKIPPSCINPLDCQSQGFEESAECLLDLDLGFTAYCIQRCR